MNNVSCREWLNALLVALVVVGVLQIPYALGYARSSPAWQFTGVVMNPEDAQSYFAKMLQGYNGAWLYTIPFTTEDHPAAFVGGFYLCLGQLARGLHLSLDAMWHWARVVSDVILFVATFGFIAAFLPARRARWTAYGLALCGSGLGWVLFLLNQPNWLGAFPVDFKMPEAHLFFTALTYPHVELGTACIIASLGCGIRIVQASTAPARLRFALSAGIANLALALAYPFLIYLIALVYVIYFALVLYRARRWLWREALAFGIAILIPAPLVLYYAATLATNPVYRAWDAQAVTPSPPLPHYLLAYGVWLVLAFLAHRRAEYTMLWAWLIAVALLVYAPLNPQRRFVEGVHLPLAILAAAGLFDAVLPRIERAQIFQALIRHPRYSLAGLERLLVTAFIGVMSLSNVYIWVSLATTTALEQPYPLFRSRDEIAAVDWLRVNTRSSDVVLSAYETGNYVAAHAGNRVVIGHWAETVDWQTKFDEMKRFFGASDEAWRLALLQKYRVQFVFFGAREKLVGTFDPRDAAYLKPVFSNSTAQIYRVLESP